MTEAQFTDDAISGLLAVMPDSALPALLGQTLRRMITNGIVTDVPGVAFRLDPDGFMSDAATSFAMNFGQLDPSPIVMQLCSHVSGLVHNGRPITCHRQAGHDSEHAGDGDGPVQLAARWQSDPDGRVYNVTYWYPAREKN